MSPAGAPSSPRRIYIDTSAYLCILLAELGSTRLAQETEGARLLSSVLLLLESKRNLVRLAREGKLKPDQYRATLDRLEEDAQRIDLRDLTLDLCQSNTMPAVVTPRSLDLGHLRTALWFHTAEPIDRFMTMDDQQQQAAKELGLPVGAGG